MAKDMRSRAEVVKAMETLVRCINYEDIIDSWLMVGVADGDIREDTTLEEIAEMGYVDDAEFKDLMTLFLRLMDRASRNGGLYCDRITSGEKKITWE